mmetsp:Transcript_8815/g.18921  ORF Transcript_8815/g.18921 Transcript_8815/m.18921 type:complete len:561 (+) Transcript_8815:135-1817(+)
MGKSRAKGKAPTGGGGQSAAWGADQHADREAANVVSLERRIAKRKKKKRRLDTDEDGNLSTYKRTALSHDTADKIDAGKLRLHITKTKRVVETERERLRTWDDVEEKKRAAEEERKRREAETAALAEENGEKNKKRRRPGPETWKLRGAARPAWEVYDFDTRYVDPHAKQHEEARAKASRSRNLLSLYRGRFGEVGDGSNEDDVDYPPQPHCRNFLALLMQLGHLSVEAKKFKSARECFLEVMELEGTEESSAVVTTARSRLMRMYLEANRPDSARRLWERLSHDGSAWIRYSAALIEYVSWRVLEEEGSSRKTAEDLACMAIAASPFCAYNIAFHGTFERVMEYGDELEDEDSGSLQEAIEYCHSEQMGSWLGTDGAVKWIRSVVLRLLNGGRSTVDSEYAEDARTRLQSWESDLARIEEEFEAAEKEKEREEVAAVAVALQEGDDSSTNHYGPSRTGGGGGDGPGYNWKKDKRRSPDGGGDGNIEEYTYHDEQSSPEEPDLLMYSGMFRTAMDMLSDAGDLLRVIEVSSDEEEDEILLGEGGQADEEGEQESHDSSED